MIFWHWKSFVFRTNTTLCSATELHAMLQIIVSLNNKQKQQRSRQSSSCCWLKLWSLRGFILPASGEFRLCFPFRLARRFGLHNRAHTHHLLLFHVRRLEQSSFNSKNGQLQQQCLSPPCWKTTELADDVRFFISSRVWFSKYQRTSWSELFSRSFTAVCWDLLYSVAFCDWFSEAPFPIFLNKP